MSVNWQKHQYPELIKAADDYAAKERQKRISRSQPLQINWMAVLGLAIRLSSAVLVLSVVGRVAYLFGKGWRPW